MNKIKFEYKININLSESGTIKLWFSKPQDDEYQKIDSFNLNHPPINSYKDDQGNELLYFEFNQKTLELKAQISATLSQEKERNHFELQNTERFLIEEEYLEQTELIKEIAKNLPREKSLAIKKLQEYVVQNFKYCYPVPNRGVANLKIESLIGDCGEYSSFMVAIARHLNIPARNETGFVIYPENNSIQEHAWIRAYLNGKWREFDPQYAQLENNPGHFAGRREDLRITFCHGLNIPLRPPLNDEFDLSIWKELGLPATKNEAQVLQPLFFAADKKLEFTENIKII
jgi:hypothetical protein